MPKHESDFHFVFQAVPVPTTDGTDEGGSGHCRFLPSTSRESLLGLCPLKMKANSLTAFAKLMCWWGRTCVVVRQLPVEARRHMRMETIFSFAEKRLKAGAARGGQGFEDRAEGSRQGKGPGQLQPC